MRLEIPLTSVDAPRTGDIARAETGSVILEQGRYRVVEAISSDGDIEWGGGLFGVQTVLPAGFLVARRHDERYTYYASLDGYLRVAGNKPGETQIVAVPDMELRVENDKPPVLNETALPNGAVVRLLTKPTLKEQLRISMTLPAIEECSFTRAALGKGGCSNTRRLTAPEQSRTSHNKWNTTPRTATSSPTTAPVLRSSTRTTRRSRIGSYRRSAINASSFLPGEYPAGRAWRRCPRTVHPIFSGFRKAKTAEAVGALQAHVFPEGSGALARLVPTMARTL